MYLFSSTSIPTRIIFVAVTSRFCYKLTLTEASVHNGDVCRLELLSTDYWLDGWQTQQRLQPGQHSVGQDAEALMSNKLRQYPKKS